jgi:hypothetical protein
VIGIPEFNVSRNVTGPMCVGRGINTYLCIKFVEMTEAELGDGTSRGAQMPEFWGTCCAHITSSKAELSF